jgi:hypothetical protein
LLFYRGRYVYSFEPNAEECCESFLSIALQLNPSSAEALQSLASVRVSQSRNEEAKELVLRAWELWKTSADEGRFHRWDKLSG